MGMYEELVNVDVLGPIQSQLVRRTMTINAGPDGEPKILIQRDNPAECPWILSGWHRDNTRRCGVWLHLYWEFYRFIPKGCYDCYKVVFKPSTLEEAMVVKSIQEEDNLLSKVGMERRDYAFGEWSAFWYNDRSQGKSGGQDLFETTKKRLRGIFGEKMVKAFIKMGRLFLKRACTEFELGVGDSDKWDYEKSRGPVLEPLLDELIYLEPLPFPQPDWVKVHILTKWIEWAYKIGDPTWQLFAGPKSFPPPAVQYQRDAGLILVGKELH